MTLLELIDDCRLRMDDLGGDTGTIPPGNTYYWEYSDAACLIKNAEWLRFLNQAHKEIAIRTSCYRDAVASENQTSYGAELLGATDWTAGLGWTETDDNTFAHTSGTATLTNSATIATATAYRLTYTVTGWTTGTVTLAVGGQSTTISASGMIDLTTSSTAGFVATPSTGFDGTVALSLTAITTTTVNPFAITVTAGTARYTVDSRILTIEDVLLSSTNLPLVKTVLVDYRNTADSRIATGTPTHYLEENHPFGLALYPIPVVNDTLYLTVYRYPLADMDWINRNVEVTEPHEALREALVQGALMYAYQKRDADTGDGGRQQFHAREFERLVGKPIDYKTLETRRWNANLDISARPVAYTPSRRRSYNSEWE